LLTFGIEVLGVYFLSADSKVEGLIVAFAFLDPERRLSYSSEIEKDLLLIGYSFDMSVLFPSTL